jgi:hypothetical protein
MRKNQGRREENEEFEIAPQLHDDTYRKGNQVLPQNNKVESYENNEQSQYYTAPKSRVSFMDFARDNIVIVVILSVAIVLLLGAILYLTLYNQKLSNNTTPSALPTKMPDRPPTTMPGGYTHPHMPQNYPYYPPTDAQLANTRASMPANMPANKQTVKPLSADEKRKNLDDILSRTRDLAIDTEDESDTEFTSSRNTTTNNKFNNGMVVSDDENDAYDGDVNMKNTENSIDDALTAFDLVD